MPVAPLFVPGDRPERVAKAAASGADAVIIDLEDAVDASKKAEARAEAVKADAGSVPLWVRVNGADTDWFGADLEALAARTVPVAGVLLPKAEAAADVSRVAQALGEVGVIPLVETARGMKGVAALLAHELTPGLAFGSIDYALDLGCEPEWEPLMAARSSLVLESRLAGKAAPIDGVTVAFGDLGRVAEEAARGRAMGFGGKLAIHPDQVAPIKAAFRPSEADVDWAHRVIEAAQDDGAVALDGQMIDKPLLVRARSILARA